MGRYSWGILRVTLLSLYVFLAYPDLSFFGRCLLSSLLSIGTAPLEEIFNKKMRD